MELKATPKLYSEPGFGVWGLGFEVWGLGFGVWGFGFGVWVWGLGFGASPALIPKPLQAKKQVNQ